MATLVKVRNKKDKFDVREMTEAMFKVVQAEWELVPGELDEDETNRVAEAIKKKVAKDAGVNSITAGNQPPIRTTTEPIIENVTESGFTGEFAVIQTLAEQYEALSGKAPDKRWKDARIQSEIDKIQPKTN